MLLAHVEEWIILSLAALAAATIAWWSSRLRRTLSFLMLALMLSPGIALWLIKDVSENRLASTLWLVIVGVAWLSGQHMQRRVRLLTCIFAVVFVLDGALIGISAYAYVERSRRLAREGEAEREKFAQQCFTELVKRSPDADAKADFERGDITPLGLSRVPHEGATSTNYPDACGGVPDGHEYKPTGKWFVRTFSSWGDALEAPSQPKCDRAGLEYVAMYNRKMVALAPEAIERFCRRVAPHSKIGSHSFK